MTVASLLILRGASGGWRPALLVAGGVIAVGLAVLALHLATSAYEDRPRPPAVTWSIAGLVLFYVLLAAAAGLAGPEYALAALAAGLIPLTALCLLLAMARSKTLEADGVLKDESAERDEDPFPGIGFEDQTPVGDTTEHSDAA
jgi:hypothetical protein